MEEPEKIILTIPQVAERIDGLVDELNELVKLLHTSDKDIRVEFDLKSEERKIGFRMSADEAPQLTVDVMVRA